MNQYLDKEKAGKQFRAIRKALKLRQKDVTKCIAEFYNIVEGDRSYISNIELGKDYLQSYIIEAIIKIVLPTQSQEKQLEVYELLKELDPTLTDSMITLEYPPSLNPLAGLQIFSTHAKDEIMCKSDTKSSVTEDRISSKFKMNLPRPTLKIK